MKNETEHKCIVCGKWFDLKQVDHSSPWWPPSGGLRPGFKRFCSQHCIGRFECNMRTAKIKPMKTQEDIYGDGDVDEKERDASWIT